MTQVVRNDDKNMELMEIGPRFVLNPIRFFAGSFGGPTLYQNFDYVSPNDARRLLKLERAKKSQNRSGASEEATFRKQELKQLDKDEFADLYDEK